MGQVIIEELYCQANEIISIPGDQTSLFLSGCLELFQVRCLHHPNFMSAYTVDTFFPEQFSYLGTQIFIQVIFHLFSSKLATF